MRAGRDRGEVGRGQGAVKGEIAISPADVEEGGPAEEDRRAGERAEKVLEVVEEGDGVGDEEGEGQHAHLMERGR